MVAKFDYIQCCCGLARPKRMEMGQIVLLSSVSQLSDSYGSNENVGTTMCGLAN